MIRPPAVAGHFYPAEPDRLREMIATLVEPAAPREEAIGIVAPHAGYIYSGGVAGAVISRINMADTFIILGPNHTGQGKPLAVMNEGSWLNPLGEVAIDRDLAERIISRDPDLKADTLAHRNEHSIEVQLPLLQYFKADFQIVPILIAYSDIDYHRALGQAIAGAIKESGRKAVIIASSDFSHYEPHEEASRKDALAIEAITQLNGEELLRRIDQHQISMCGYGPTVALLAAARELGATRAELVKYQTSGEISGDYSTVVGYAGIIIRGMSPPVELAKATVENYVRSGRVPPLPDDLSEELKPRAGVFVSLHKAGELRGCIGTFEPYQDNVAAEIIANAVSAASSDPRFLPVTADELADLEYSVDVLTTPEPVTDKNDLDPKKYGLIVEAGRRRGLLLPDLEGVDSVDFQIDICRQKAGIGPDEPVRLYRFQVTRYK